MFSWSRFCTVNCRPMASSYQLSHLRSGRDSNSDLSGGRHECYHSATMAPNSDYAMKTLNLERDKHFTLNKPSRFCQWKRGRRRGHPLIKVTGNNQNLWQFCKRSDQRPKMKWRKPHKCVKNSHKSSKHTVIKTKLPSRSIFSSFITRGDKSILQLQ